MNPIQIPARVGRHGLITFEEFCDLIRTPQRTVRDWRRRGVGPRWARFNGCGRLYITVAEARRFLSLRHPHTPQGAATMAEKTLPVYLSLEEAAEVMSLSIKTIRRRIADGTIPAYQCGRRPIRIRLDELEAALRRIPSARW